MDRLDRLDYFDITPAVSAKTAVFPGDQSFARHVQMSFARGDHLELSSITTTLHIGAHADAPLHYDPQGVAIDAVDLHLYMGQVQVMAVKGLKPKARIVPEDLQGQKIVAPRVLLRTDSFPDPERWVSDFHSLSPELIDDLHSQGVRLVGIDTPSIDPEDSKKLESHQRVAHYRMAVLEGLVLKDVPDGVYLLMALPLKLQGCDGSPVRAILLK